MLRLIRWLRSYVEFAILGRKPTEAVALARKHGITLYRVQSQGGLTTAVCSVGDYRRFGKLLRKKNRRKRARQAPVPPVKGNVGAPLRQEEWWEVLLKENTPEPPKPREP